MLCRITRRFKCHEIRHFAICHRHSITWRSSASFGWTGTRKSATIQALQLKRLKFSTVYSFFSGEFDAGMVQKFQTGALSWNHSITQIRCWRESRFCRKLAEPAKNCWLAKSTWKQLNFSGTYTKVSVLFAVARKEQCKEEPLI